MKNKLLILGNALLFSLAAHASWPTFTPPPIDDLVKSSLLISTDCPNGYYHLANLQKISVSQNCKSFCPPEWQWQAFSKINCVAQSEIHIRGTAVSHILNEDGETLYSTVEVDYGNENSIGKMIFTTPSEYWYCYETNKNSHEISCANDRG